MAAVGNTHLQPVEPSLPFLDPRLRAEAMLQEEKAAPWLEDAVHFAQSSVNMFDTTQRKGAHHAIEDAPIEGELFPAQNPLVHFDPRLLDPLLRQPVHADIGIDDGDLADSFRIARQVQPSAEAD